MPKREWEFLSDLHDGNLGVNTRRNVQRLFLSLQEKSEGKTVRVRLRVSVVRRSRSQPQNRYYWAVIVRACREGLAEEWGLGTWEDVDKDDAHHLLKTHCNGREIVNKNTGEVVPAPNSSAALNTLEFEDYAEKCRRFILEWFGITVPLPNEQLSMDIDEESDVVEN